jgi:hypothetical protein
MPEKIKKNLLGRTVVKKSTQLGDKTINRRTVYGRDNQMIKNKSVSVDSNTGAKETRFIKGTTSKTKKVSTTPSGQRTVTKSKTSFSGGPMVSKKTTKTGTFGKKTRSVTTKKPGYSSVQTNMGALSQARTFRNQVKKNK